MSSDLQSALELLQLNDYASVVMITAVVYDYFLTLSREIEYIWCRPWTWVSALFVMVRYLGLCWAILTALPGSTFVPGPVKVSTALYVSSTCVFPIFIAAANLIMILRVYAIWNQSGRILFFLLSIYVPGVISSFVFVGLYSNPNTYLSITVLRLAAHFSICSVTFNNTPMLLFMYMEIPRFVLGVAILVLTVIRAWRQLVEMYKATKQWRLNQCIQQLVRDGIIYFLMNALYNVSTGFNNEPSINSTAMLVLDTACITAIAVMMPRFIINVRELYDPVLRGVWEGIDPGFRVFPRPISRQSTTVSMEAFLDITPGWRDPIVEGGGDELGEVTPLEVLRDYMRRL
ncbi:hypothetical protein V8E55_008986 [Tylopilus felleus]